MQVFHPHFSWRRAGGTALLTATALLSGCDMLGTLGVVTPGQKMAEAEAESKAIGGACRHALRSIEDCYRDNPKSSKAQVFEGWREMDTYMRENEIEGMPSAPVPPVPQPVVEAPSIIETNPEGKDGKAAKPEKPAKAATGAAAP